MFPRHSRVICRGEKKWQIFYWDFGKGRKGIEDAIKSVTDRMESEVLPCHVNIIKEARN